MEAFRIKLNSVAEMLNPAMLALNPEKYAAKMEAINTVYQNVKESREQMQQMLELNQQELERQLFEAEASWSEKLEKKADEFLEGACDYLKRSAECLVLGNFTEEVTLLGVGGQVLAGLAGVDFPLDVRDIIADVKNIGEAEKVQWEQVAIFLLDLCALLPVIGCLKYADEAAVLVKHADEAADLVKHADKLKYVDEAGELLTEGRKLADSGIKGLEDAVAEARKLEKELAGSKLLDDVVGGGRYSVEDFKREMSLLPHPEISDELKKKIIDMPKGEKILPSMYMDSAAIKNHLKLFDNGVVKIQSKESYEISLKMYGGTIGDPVTGTFVLPRDVAEKAIKASQGNPRILEELLALDSGYLGDSPVLIEIKKYSNVRMPSGNEAGAWEDLWIPGGYTEGGIPEAVIDQVKVNEYYVSDIYN